MKYKFLSQNKMVSQINIKIHRLAIIWFLAALIIRVAATIIIHIYSINTGFDGYYPLSSGADDRYYYWAGQLLASGGQLEKTPNIYPYILKYFMMLVGPDILYSKLLNALLGAVSVYYAVLIAVLLESRHKGSVYSIGRSANIVGALLTFYPSAMFYSTQLLKDAAVIAIGLATIYWMLMSIGNLSIYKIIKIIIGLIILLELRGYAAMAIIVGILIYIIFVEKAYKKIYGIIILIMLSIIPMLMGYGLFGTKYMLTIINPSHVIQMREHIYSKGGSAVGIHIDYNNPFNFAKTYIYSIITVMFGPLPWQIKSKIMLIGLIETIVYVIIIIVVFNKRKRKINNRAKILIIISIIYFSGLALVVDNIGAITRLRMLPWYILIIAIGLQISGEKNRNIINIKNNNINK